MSRIFLIGQFLVWQFFCGSLIADDRSLPQRVEKFLLPRLQSVVRDEPMSDAIDSILSRPDPGTFFLRYAFGLKQHAKELLTLEKAGQLTAVIERWSPAHSRSVDSASFDSLKLALRVRSLATRKGSFPQIQKGPLMVFFIILDDRQTQQSESTVNHAIKN